MPQHRAVRLEEDISAHFDDMIGSDAEDVVIKSGMMNLAQRQAVRDHRYPARVSVGEDMGGIYQVGDPQSAHRACFGVGLKNLGAKHRLVQTLLRKSPQIVSLVGVERRTGRNGSLLTMHRDSELQILGFVRRKPHRR